MTDREVSLSMRCLRWLCLSTVALLMGVSCSQDTDTESPADAAHHLDVSAQADGVQPTVAEPSVVAPILVDPTVGGAGDSGKSDAPYKQAPPGMGEHVPKGDRDSGSVLGLEPRQLLTASGTPNPLAHSPVLIFDFDVGDDLAALLPRFILRHESHFPEGDMPQLLRYTMSGRPQMGIAVDVVSVFDAGDWLGFFMESGPDVGCAWTSAQDAYLVSDPFGQHPMLTSNRSQWDTSLSAEFASLSGRVHDWSTVPARGEAFYRQWRSQEHLVEVPHRDGLVFRYEGGGRYQPRAQKGRGNSAHHWNLLAYDLEMAAVSSATERDGCFSRLIESQFPIAWLDRYGALFDAEWVASTRSGATENGARGPVPADE